jgi:glycosyltransferase involved in cell wall biosynthesis
MNHDQNQGSDWSDEFVEEIEFGKPNGGVLDKARKSIKAVYSIEARSKIARIIDRIEPDLCHAHNIYHHISPSILGVIHGRGIPLVMTLHDLKIACPAYSMLSNGSVCERCRDGALFHVAKNRCMKGSAFLSTLVMVESYLHRFLGSYTNNVDRFIVPSRFYFNKLVEWGFDAARFDYVPNFVDTDEFEPNFVPGDRFVYFGRLSPEKGVVTLIRAASAAGVGLDIVGTGPLTAGLQELAARCAADVRFHGFLSGQALRRAIMAARAVVVPSEWYENAPLSVLESFAMGKPVIAATIGGLPELVIEDETGWLFESGSIDALAARLRQVANLSDGRVRSAGEAAWQNVADEYSPRRYLDEIRDIYGRLGVA